MDLFRSLIQCVRWIIHSLAQLWRKFTSPPIVFDTGRSVRLGKQIAEGGFSYVFEAFDANNPQKKYALKRIHVGDSEAVRATLREAGVHRSFQHAHLMPCLGVHQEQRSLIYLLFPYVPTSLRSVVNQSVFETSPPTLPFTELQVLQLFYQILSAVQAMHRANVTHRDIKLENVLLKNPHHALLMDFGSAGPLREDVETRSQILTMTEQAAQHTTLAYRPPELLEAGGVRKGDAPIDFTLVDVWSLGCTLFAMCFGASPFECEFRKPSSHHSRYNEVRVVDCSALRILGSVPTPPVSTYSPHILALIQSMLIQNRHERPTLDHVIAQVASLIQKLGAKVPQIDNHEDEEDDSDLDALLSSNRFV